MLIISDILEKLRPDMEKAVIEIKKAVLELRPIIIRHHNDCDGYSGGIAVEKAISRLLKNKYIDERSMRKYLRRTHCRAPFYSYSDATRDLAFALDNVERFGAKLPLMIIIDNGSSIEDELGIKKLRLYGIKVIVIDHHIPHKTDEDIRDIHINPHLVGGDSYLTAGMLSVETASMIAEDESIRYLAALSGVGDRQTHTEEFKRYMDLASKAGYDTILLGKIAESINFEAFYLGNIDANKLIADLMGEDKKNQRRLVELIYSEASRRRKDMECVVDRYKEEKEVGGKHIYTIDLEKVSVFGEYPLAGKITALLSDSTDSGIVMGVSDHFITFRAKEEEFNIMDIIKLLSEKLPYALITGGGHAKAGSIRFIPAAKEEAIKIIYDYIKSL